MEKQTLFNLIEETFKVASSKGFWDKQFTEKEGYVQEKCMLVVSEMGEALEAHRKNRRCKIEQWNNKAGDWFTKIPNGAYNDFELIIKDTFEDEIADVYIRVMDLIGGYMNSDILKENIWQWKVKVSSSTPTTKNIGKLLLANTAAACSLGICLEDKDFQNSSIYAGQLLGGMQQIANHWNFDLEKHIKLKLEYNNTRERLHGKEY